MAYITSHQREVISSFREFRVTNRSFAMVPSSFWEVQPRPSVHNRPDPLTNGIFILTVGSEMLMTIFVVLH
jgi:hypothetical protein